MITKYSSYVKRNSQYARAMKNYNVKGHLTIAKGDVIKILGKEDNMYSGDLNGVQGLVQVQ
jgi:hypothetical protein